MAHWAEIDENNIVLRVTVGDNDDPSGDEGYQWIIDNLGGTWIKTSFNSSIRGKFAGIGDTYDAINDRFISPQPYPSWNLDSNFVWKAPVEEPTDARYDWDESTLSWIKYSEENN